MSFGARGEMLPEIRLVEIVVSRILKFPSASPAKGHHGGTRCSGSEPRLLVLDPLCMYWASSQAATDKGATKAAALAVDSEDIIFLC